MFAKIVTLQVLSLVCWPGTMCSSQNSDYTTHGAQDSQDHSCLHKSPIQEWTSRLLVEDLLARSNKREGQDQVNYNRAQVDEKRTKMKRRGSLQLLIQGHNRTNGKINARTRYQVELVNSMVRDVKALIVIAPVNQATCGLGALIRNKSEKESIILNDNCHLRAETFLPAKAKRDFTWMTPGCGCLNVSAHFAFYTNNKMRIMNPKRLKDTLPNKILCVGPTLSRAEQMAEVRRSIMKQREAKLQRKRGRRQRQNRAGQQLTIRRPTKKKKTSSVNAGGNSVVANKAEEAGTSDGNFYEETITDDGEEESSESDETSESEEDDDEDENSEDDVSPTQVTEGNHIEDETYANTRKENKKRIQRRNKISKLEGKKRKKMAKRRRHLQKFQGGGRKQQMDGLKRKNKGKRGNYFKGSRLCCRQGIKHKKMIVYMQLQQNKERMEGCDDASLELLSWVKENLKVSKGFCSRRFAQCCLGWRASTKQVGASNSIQNDS